jgi:hypothetical protein
LIATGTAAPRRWRRTRQGGYGQIMHSHTFAAIIGGGFLVVFLLYYVIYIASVPLSFIMVAIIVMVCVNMYEESRQQIDIDNDNDT